MPELPEVETVRSDLAQYVVGKKIKNVTIQSDFAKKIEPSVSEFINKVTGQTIKAAQRRGKLLILDLGDDHNVLIHLKMTGQLVFWWPGDKIVPGGHPIIQTHAHPDKYNKVLFTFYDGSRLYYNDPRKFGYLKYVNNAVVATERSKYGVEPIDAAFTFKYFDSVLEKKKNLAIKKVLLMQDYIAGIGNIYADESCYAAGVLGTRVAKTLTLEERKKLYQSIKRIINKAIKYRGTSVANYTDGVGQQGNYARFLKVYSRVGKPCLKCKTTIKRTVVGGRGTSYCPKCQQ